MIQHPDNSVGAEELRDGLAALFEEAMLAVHKHYEPGDDPEFGEAASDYAQAALSLPTSEAWKPPEGFVVVPREPTEEMLMAAGIASKVVGHDDQGRRTTRYLAVELTATIYIAMISAAPDQPSHEGGWKDISSAPKDGTPILGFVPTFSEPCIVLIDWVTFDGSDKPGYWADRWSDAGDEIEDAPTHWQPLPTRPTHTKEG